MNKTPGAMSDATPSHAPARIERLLAIGAYIAWVACLAAPAFVANDDPWPGWGALMFGPVGVPIGYLAWLANPMLWYAWLARRAGKPVRAIVASAVAMLLALSFLLHEKIPVGSSGDYPFSVEYGYGIWLLSMALTLAAAYLAFLRGLRE